MNITVIIVELLIMFLAFGFLVIGLLMISPFFNDMYGFIYWKKRETAL